MSTNAMISIKTSSQILENLMEAHPKLNPLKDIIMSSFLTLKKAYENGGKVLVCGNGGSASDSEHIVGELMKGFVLKREIDEDKRTILNDMFEDGEYLANHLQGALPAISLVSHPALAYAFINDVAPDMVFAQQVFGYGKSGDVLIGLSTSGNSKNVVNAVKVAKAFGLLTIGFTGEEGGIMKDLCDININVPAKETYMVQELHLPVYHALCAMIEAEFFGGEKR